MALDLVGVWFEESGSVVCHYRRIVRGNISWMVASYEEFAAEHRGEHLTAFNRWCAVVGNYSNVPTAIALLLGRPRVAAGIFSLGTVVLVAGHVAEGNLTRSLLDLVHHPIWATRADFALANATIQGVLKA